MWNLLFAELLYNLPIFAVMSLVTLFVTAVQVHAPDSDLPLYMILFTIPVYGAVIWMIRRNKEKRDVQVVRLPVAAWRIEATRILIVCLVGWFQVGINSIMRLTAHAFSASDLQPLFTVWGVYYFLMMLKLSLRSYLIYFIRFNRWIGISKERSVRILIVFSTMINFYLIYLFFRRKESTEVVLLRIIGYVRNPVPFTGEYGFFFFTGACLIAAMVTMYGYQRKKSFLI